jgi:hypothetical protein
MNPAKVEMRIEELVLYNFAPSEGRRIGDAMKRELTRLFAEHSSPSSLDQRREIARTDDDSFEVKPGSTVEAVGVQVAQVMYRRLST